MVDKQDGLHHGVHLPCTMFARHGWGDFCTYSCIYTLLIDLYEMEKGDNEIIGCIHRMLNGRGIHCLPRYC